MNPHTNTTPTINPDPTTPDVTATGGDGATTAPPAPAGRHDEKLEAARAVLAAGVAHLRDDPDALAAYLRFKSRFRTYSTNNALLVLMQRPDARFCKGYGQWQKEGRQVRKGEKGLMIYAPLLRKPTADDLARGAEPDRPVVFGFKVVFVFDYQQTEAVRPDALTYEGATPRLDAEGYDALGADLARVARALGYAVVTRDGIYEDGYCAPGRREIGLRAGLSSADRASVLAHELAHALAHEGDRTTTRASKELQAEGAAYMALHALGLDTSRAALPYLKGWAGSDDAALTAELAAIDRIAGELLRRVEVVRGADAGTPAA